ncbi:hypothetical protein INR49_031775 [Caranx melampygus]|nr:hypothetical protein INR49_031775 [Caranx melampygus]
MLLPLQPLQPVEIREELEFLKPDLPVNHETTRRLGEANLTNHPRCQEKLSVSSLPLPPPSVTHPYNTAQLP